MGKRKSRSLFHVLGGRTYSEKERPSFWRNTMVPYEAFGIGESVDKKKFLLHPFPLIEDFQIVLEETKDRKGKSPFGYQAYFYSPSRGYLANFPYWDHIEKDMRQDDFSIPLGDLEAPFSDLEQGWEIVILEHGKYVYILQGSFNEGGTRGYDRWFKVYKHLYMHQWKEAIRACHATKDDAEPQNPR